MQFGRPHHNHLLQLSVGKSTRFSVERAVRRGFTYRVRSCFQWTYDRHTGKVIAMRIEAWSHFRFTRLNNNSESQRGNIQYVDGNTDLKLFRRKFPDLKVSPSHSGTDFHDLSRAYFFRSA